MVSYYMKKIFLILISLLISFESGAIYSVPHVKDSVYLDAAKSFPNVFKIRVRGSGPFEESYGSGSYVYDLTTGQHFILTAAHVLTPGSKAELLTEWGNFPLSHPFFFPHDMITFYEKDTLALSFENAVRGERLYGGRIDKDNMIEAITHYGGDLAIIFLPPNLTLPIPPLQLASHYDPENTKDLKAVGFGTSGIIRPIGSYTGSVYGSGQKRAYHPVLKTGVVIKGINLKTGEQWYHPSWMSILQEDTVSPLPGQVGYGDSGGPLLVQEASQEYHIIGVVSSTLPASRSALFLKKATPWQKFILKLGKGIQDHSYMAYVLGQESNTYGSEALFSGVISPLVHKWISRSIQKYQQKNTFPPAENP